MTRLVLRLCLALAAGLCLATAGRMLRSLEVAPLVAWRFVAGCAQSWLLTAVGTVLAGGATWRAALTLRREPAAPGDRVLRDALLVGVAGAVFVLVVPPLLYQVILLRMLPDYFPGGLDEVPRSAARFLAATGAFGLIQVATVAAVLTEVGRAFAAEPPTPRRAAGLVATIYLGLTVWLVQVQSLTGDEPHYLLAARSLIADGDLDLTNDYAERRYRDFWPSDTLRRALPLRLASVLDPHEVRDLSGRGRPIHPLGVSLAVLPAFAVGGWLGALLVALAVGWAAAWQAARLTLRLDDSEFGWLAAAALAFGSPLLAFAASLHAEPAGALACGYLAWLAIGGRAAGRWPAAVALAALPVLHWKLVPAGALLALFVLLDDRRAGRRDAWLPPFGLLVGVVAAMMLNLGLYGSPWPDAPQRLSGGRYPSLFSGNPLLGLPGLLVDQQDGLFWAWPLGLAAVPGIALLARSAPHRRLLAAIALHLALVAGYALWGSGHAPPGRQLLPVLPLLGPFVAAGLRWLWLGRPALLRGLVLVNGALVLANALVPRLRYPLFGGRFARHPLLGTIDQPACDLLLPVVRSGPAALAVAWVYLLALLFWGVAVARRRGGILRHAGEEARA